HDRAFVDPRVRLSRTRCVRHEQSQEPRLHRAAAHFGLGRALSGRRLVVSRIGRAGARHRQRRSFARADLRPGKIYQPRACPCDPRGLILRRWAILLVVLAARKAAAQQPRLFHVPTAYLAPEWGGGASSGIGSQGDLWLEACTGMLKLADLEVTLSNEIRS